MHKQIHKINGYNDLLIDRNRKSDSDIKKIKRERKKERMTALNRGTECKREKGR